MILEKEILDSLQRVGSFDDINKIIYRCEEKAELNQIDVLPFAKAYAALLMNSDAFFSGEEGKKSAGLCAYNLANMDRTGLKNSSDPDKELLEECVVYKPHEVLLKHCNSFNDLLRIIHAEVEVEEELKNTYGDCFAEALLALKDRLQDSDEMHKDNELGAFIKARNAIMDMILIHTRDEMDALNDATGGSSKRDLIIGAIVLVLLLAYVIYSMLHPEVANVE